MSERLRDNLADVRVAAVEAIGQLGESPAAEAAIAAVRNRSQAGVWLIFRREDARARHERVRRKMCLTP